MNNTPFLALLILITALDYGIAQEHAIAPPNVNGGSEYGDAPSDAIVLLDGTDLSAFHGGEQWRAADDFVIVAGGERFIETKRAFGNCQLHLEFATPSRVSGNGQNRGNSGIYFMGLYEVQILDSHENETYATGQCGALYFQTPPAVNACRKPGEWQSYDIAFTAPSFDTSGELVSPAKATVFLNGVLIQHDIEFKGPTDIRPKSHYESHTEKLPLRIQNHHCAVQFRNIWIRENIGHSEAEMPVETKTSGNTAASLDTDEWANLLDNGITQWDKFVGVPHPSVKGLPTGTPTSENFKTGTPLGAGNDPLNIFSIDSKGGEPVVRISGEIYGALTSKKEYENYHLKMDFKWGTKKYIPRMNLGRDSGLLYHSVGPFGAYASSWMDCLECQIMERDYGDLFCLGNTSAVVGTNTPQANERPIFQPRAKRSRLKIARRLKDYGHPLEWNTAEVLTIGNRAIHVINGKAVMALTDARIGTDGKGEKLDCGKIQIQSEGAELFVRRVKMKSLSTFPQSLLNQLNLDEELYPRKRTATTRSKLRDE